MNNGIGYKKILLFLLLSFAGKRLLVAQPLNTEYRGIIKETIYFESFDAVNSNWLTPQGKLENGTLIMSDRLNMETPKTFTVISINENRDFEIELTASATSGVLPGRIHWNSYCWELTAGLSSIVFLKESNIKYIGNKSVKNSPDKYTIRKYGTTLYYFIDEKNVATTAFVKFDIPEKMLIGFSGKINVDDVRVSYLSKGDPFPVQKTEENITRTNNAAESITADKKHVISAGGKFYALIIGVSKYDEPKLYLENPENDAKQIKKILTSRYTFTDSTTFLLLNPTRQKILSELYRLRKIIGPNDNFLIFYAGHGYWDKDARQGYWWARDAGRDDPSTWLSNSDLREQIRSIKSAHTLLISDACFSGGIFKTRSVDDLINASKDIQILYKMPSRRAITSGTMTPVPDISVFMEYFMKRLNDNQVRFLSSQQLFDSFRSAVINNSSVVPQDGVIAETGDEGGDFIFMLKNK